MLPLLSSIVPALGALGAVIALVLLAGRIARLTGVARSIPRLGVARAARMSVADTLALDRTRRLHIIRVDEKEILLLTGGATDLVVGRLPFTGDGA